MATIAKPRTLKGRAVLCAKLAQEKLAHDILLLELTELESSPAEFFVIVTVDSEAQMKAVSDSIFEAVKGLGLGSPRFDAKTGTSWTIMDYFDIVVHIMLPDAREFYNLERLWGDGNAFTLTASGTARATTIARRKV